jgi:phage shock protein A
VSKVTIDIYDEDPNEIALIGDMMHALAAYRANLDEEPIGVEEDGTLPPAEQAGVEVLEAERQAANPTPTPQKRKRRTRAEMAAAVADVNPDKEPPLPLTATAAGTPLKDDAQAVAAAITGEIVLLDSSGTPKAAYGSPELAANALIEILKAAPSKDSLDNLLTVNSSTLGKLGKESDRVIAAYGDLTAKLKTEAAPPAPAAVTTKVPELDKLLTEIGDSTKPPSPAAPGPLPVIVGPMPPAEQLVQACGDLLQAYARDKGAGFVGALNLLTKEFGVDNIKKIAADKLPALYKRLAELVQAP